MRKKKMGRTPLPPDQKKVSTRIPVVQKDLELFDEAAEKLDLTMGEFLARAGRELAAKTLNDEVPTGDLLIKELRSINRRLAKLEKSKRDQLVLQDQ